MKYLKLFESFEDFTHVDIEDVRDLFEEGLTDVQIAEELDFSLNKVRQIISVLNRIKQKNTNDEYL